MSRRQNSSCDQCRKGKRACDLFSLQQQNQLVFQVEDGSSPASDSLPLQQNGDIAARSKCTNCAKTNKKCTLEWLLSQKARPAKRRLSVNSNASSAKRIAPAPANLYPTPENEASDIAVDNKSQMGVSGADSSLWEMSEIMDPSAQATAEAWNMFCGDGFSALDMNLNGDAFTVYNEPALFEFSPFPSVSAISQPSLEEQSHDAVAPSRGNSMIAETFDQGSTSQLTQETRDLQRYTASPVENGVIVEQTRRRRPRRSSRSNHQRQLVVMPFSGNQQNLVTRINSTLTTDNLMQVYHDVMEGALSCWLTEQTCPYKMVSNSTTTGETMAQEWGPNWSNRILNRVLKLDRVAPGLGVTPLSQGQNREATQALRLAIMAFTTQWAQSSQRSREKYSPDIWDKSFQPEAEFFEGFDRTVQKSFWNQARIALDSCIAVDSFTVAYAEIIFGLTHKYLEGGDEDRARTDVTDCDVYKNIDESLKSDPSSLYLERAARRLHVLKRRVEMKERRSRGLERVNMEYDKTIGLLYWLSIMFDTISSAMTERPVTVTDEDSRGTVELEQVLVSSATGWNETSILYPRDRLSPLRWPSSEAAVAKVLTQAAPVKVLLFRKVTALQSLVGRGERGVIMEKAIQDALLVYRHWNMAYGPLFDDFIDQHDSLPPRIQSWYICLLGHWLLAALLLSQWIILIDDSRLGVPDCSEERMQNAVAQKLQRDSVLTISDLANASTPLEGEKPLQQFHSSVSESALLTEPWTVVLVRSFGLAGAMLLQSPRADSVDSQFMGGFEDNMSRCDDCIRALWQLGKKSDSARQVAGMLSAASGKARMRWLNSQRQNREVQHP